MQEGVENTDTQNNKNKGNKKKLIIIVVLISLYIVMSLFGLYIILNSAISKIESYNSNSEVKIETEIDKVDNIDYTHLETTVIDVSAVVKEVMPSMVSVTNNYTEVITNFWGQSYAQEATGSGSGIIIGENGTELLIATNYHVIAGSNSIEIVFIDETVVNAYIKGTNPEMDLAVVSVMLEDLNTETKNSIAVASLGNSEQLELGEPVIAIGNALGYGQSVTTGVVSALNREVQNEDGTTASFIQTDAAINPGNSGGALLDMKGNVIGINSSKIGGSTVEGIGFAIPISAAEPIINDLSSQTTKIKVEESKRGYLGISIDERTDSYAEIYGIPKGLFVSKVDQGGAAETAGLQRYDIITKFDTFEITSYADLQNALQYYEAEETVDIEVMRLTNGEYISITLQITLAVRPEM